MTVEIVGLRGIPEVTLGNDLAGLIVEAIEAAGLTVADDDILVVTQKVVSKAEGRVVPVEPVGKAAWVEREARRIVARRGGLLIAETRHGFVCANAGVDESNVAEGFLSLLPEDPDRSAASIRARVAAATSADVGVVITDTFGRPWRRGLVNVAIGCAGLPALVDLRGTKDALGRVLEVTVEALADEVAAAAGLAMGKADGIPVALVRGIRAEAPDGPASSLVRSPEQDLFRFSTPQAIRRAGSAGAVRAGDVDRDALLEAVSVACAAARPEGTAGEDGPLFVAVTSRAARGRVAGSLGANDRDVLDAPAVLVVFVRPNGADSTPWLLAGGAAVQSLLTALAAGGLAGTWAAPRADRPADVAEAVGLSEDWLAVGLVTVGYPTEPSDPEPIDRLDVAFREVP